jgi:Flp pilus assembly protein TadG
MMKNTKFRNMQAVQGQSLIELSLLLPLLLLLVFGVIDYARAIQYNNILVAMSREGANLAARSNMTHSGIIKALVSTATPLLMGDRGMVYVTQINGTKVGNDVKAKVIAQTRATTGDASLYSSLPRPVWNHCTTWVNSVCTNISATSYATLPLVNGVDMPLSDGEEVFAVEVMYNYSVIFNYVMKIGPKLYSQTVL